MRKLRYRLQDYMLGTLQFEAFEGATVLEVGCGGGIDLAEYARHGAMVYGIDLVEQNVASTTRLLGLLGLSGHVEQSGATALPFPDNMFDLVHSFGVLHHIPDAEKAVGEIRRVLKPDGLAQVMLYNRDSLLYYHSIIWLRGIKQGLLKTMTESELLCRFSERNEGCPYTRAYTESEARELFGDFTHTEVEFHYNAIDTLTRRKVKVKELPDGHRLGWHLIVKARK
jgi:2-polyprenyl-3-methyl-5-hydroxy-6-metoxy-1,4-benzoquinol methylase